MISDISIKSDLQASNTDKITGIIYDISKISEANYNQSEELHDGAINQTQFIEKVSTELKMLMEDIEKAHLIVKTFKV